MYTRTTTVRTCAPVKVDFFPADLTDEDALNPLPSLAEFEIGGTLVAARKLYSEADWDCCEAIFEAPLHLCAFVAEGDNGEVAAFMTAMVDMAPPMFARFDDAPFAFQQIAQDAGAFPFPLGIVRRSSLERRYPTDFAEEAKDMVANALGIPVREEMEDAVDMLLGSL